jgi:hypothetical protein
MHGNAKELVKELKRKHDRGRIVDGKAHLVELRRVEVVELVEEDSEVAKSLVV